MYILFSLEDSAIYWIRKISNKSNLKFEWHQRNVNKFDYILLFDIHVDDQLKYKKGLCLPFDSLK